MKKITLYNDDCLNVLKTLDDNSIDSCVTDPPYGLSFMGKSWDYDVPQKEIWEQVYRVLKPGAHLLAFFGSRTYHRGAVQIEDAGFEIRDQIMWLYGSGFPKSHNIGKAIDKHKRGVLGKTEQWDGWGTALKPAHEPIVVARKPIIQTVAKNVLEYGTGALNIDGCRVEYSEDNPPIPQLAQGKTKINSKKTMFDGQSLNKSSTEAVIGGNLSGRWPANVIHDGSDEVVSRFPQTGSGNNKQPYSYAGREYDNKDTSMFNGDKPQAPSNYNDTGSAARFFYCAKASKKDRDENNNHPTVKPTELMKYLCRLVTPPSGIVLDPFMGSGSTGKAALQERFKFVGIEMNKEYFEIAEQRISSSVERNLMDVFLDNEEQTS